MKTGARGQSSGFRGSWVAAVAVALAAGCSTPPEPQFTDADWVSNATTGRGAYERGDFRRAADAYARAQQRARALDDADALAVSAVTRATCLLAAGQAAAVFVRAGWAAALVMSVSGFFTDASLLLAHGFRVGESCAWPV